MKPEIKFSDAAKMLFLLAIVVLVHSLEAHWDHKEIITYPNVVRK